MSEEAPTVIDRRMTIIEEPVEVIQRPASSQTLRHITDEEIFKKPAPVVQSPIAKPRIEEEIVKQVVEKVRVSKLFNINDEILNFKQKSNKNYVLTMK